MKLNHEHLLSIIPTRLIETIEPCVLTGNLLSLLSRIADEVLEGVGPISRIGDITDAEISTYLDVMADAAADTVRYDFILRELDDLNARALGLDFLPPISYHLITAQPLSLDKIMSMVLAKIYRVLLGKVFAAPHVQATDSE